ncbi:hypothetical protein PS627_00682 [Pseudomonas fluorescens]|uniref:hypothetical protein n=1 Tax=Pseudomonas fluorescens TaxID=294 RepID=UPI001252BAB5|nr:hypothetical protein [Pseudomonas fluorescens]CAG8863744.1 hypothetical protein PS627_00682 [Pseudomonas fluorescens]VVP70222.1 hypothetical protein PS910_00720 [Pseudomonas fluorescens]
MSESFFEDLSEEYPINSQVRCGQTAMRLGFANMTLDESEQLKPGHLQRIKKGRFTPRVPIKR